MKKIILIVVVFFMISCNSQKSREMNTRCNISESENLMAYDSLYLNIDTTKVFKDKLKDFEENKTGILLCQFLPNKKYGKFTQIKSINNKLACFNSNSSTEKEIVLKDSETKLLLNSIHSINKKYYYEECDKYISNDAFYLMLIKREGEVIAKYFLHGNLSFKEADGNENLNMLKSVLDIMYRNSFK